MYTGNKCFREDNTETDSEVYETNKP